MLRQTFVRQHLWLGNDSHVDESRVLGLFSSLGARDTRGHRIHYATYQTDDSITSQKVVLDNLGVGA